MRIPPAVRRDSDFILIAAGFALLCLFTFWSDITEWLWELLPTGGGLARFMWQGIGVLLVTGILSGIYFSTGLAGQRRPSAIHGVAGIITGFLLLTFTAAFLYHRGYVFWFSLLGGVVASLLVKILFAYWRTRVMGQRNDRPGAVQVSYRQRVIRRE